MSYYDPVELSTEIPALILYSHYLDPFESSQIPADHYQTEVGKTRKKRNKSVPRNLPRYILALRGSNFQEYADSRFGSYIMDDSVIESLQENLMDNYAAEASADVTPEEVTSHGEPNVREYNLGGSRKFPLSISKTIRI